jgi:hypothetical protein
MTVIDLPRFTTRQRRPARLPDHWPHLGQIKRKHTTLPATDSAKAEQVELFFGRGQIIVLGSHVTYHDAPNKR